MILRKAVFLVLDLSWNLFRRTGNIETYLLMKELEDSPQPVEETSSAPEQQRDS
ncbi:YqzL family protein [Halobacillus campisalis]|uniref:YqzL family protein n=1 Tax=Halobacillus campisalis TaxID=435909 RepID=A0ABW2K469_9BACI